MAQENLAGNTKKKPNYKKSKKYKKYSKPRVRSRTWLITQENPSEEFMAQLDDEILFPGKKIEMLLAQDEIGSKTKTYHIHVGVKFSGTVEFGVMKKFCPKARLDACNSTDGTFIYCGKLSTRQDKRWMIGNVEHYIEIPPPTEEEIAKEVFKNLGYEYETHKYVCPWDC